MKLRLLAATCLVACPALPAKDRDWQIGALLATAARDSSGGPTAISLSNARPSTAMAEAAAANPRLTWQALRIQANGYSFLAMCPVRPKHTLNVTVNGPVKYAIEKDKLYLLDDDGKEWEMTVLEKALVPALPSGQRKE